MADLLKRLVGPVQLAGAAATVYTTPAATITTIRCIHIVNTSASAVGFTMSLGADAAGTRIYNSYTIAGADVFDWTGSIVMNAAEILQMYAGTAATLTAIVSGVESA